MNRSARWLRLSSLRRNSAVLSGLVFWVAASWSAEGSAHELNGRRRTMRRDDGSWAFGKVQTGGWIGAVTAGLGIGVAGDVLNLSGYYGWVPESVGGTSIHTVAALISVRTWRTWWGPSARWIPMYVSVGGLMTFGEGFFIQSPEPYPNSYYPATATHFLYQLGTEMTWWRWREASPPRGHGAFVEVTGIYHHTQVWARNTKRVSLLDALSTSIGYKICF